MHVAIVMDGNGRWATRRGRPRVAGHERGAARIRLIVEAAPALSIRVLTLYAFSADNWRRPAAEVEALMALFERYLCGEVARLQQAGVRLTVIGRRDRLPAALRARIADVERRTAAGSRLWLRLAIDYSSREALRQAAAAAWSLPQWSSASFECCIRDEGSKPAPASGSGVASPRGSRSAAPCTGA